MPYFPLSQITSPCLYMVLLTSCYTVVRVCSAYFKIFVQRYVDQTHYVCRATYIPILYVHVYINIHACMHIHTVYVCMHVHVHTYVCMH